MERFLKDNFKLLFIISIAGTLLVVLASIVYRTLKGKHLPAVPEQDIKFTERWVSGVSHKNLLTKLGGASNCLSVTLSRNALIVRPMFPFNLMFLPEVYDLEHFIPRSKIKRIQMDEHGKAGSIIIEFESDSGERRVKLMLRKREEFLRAINM
jgi:hypothetical protein